MAVDDDAADGRTPSVTPSETEIWNDFARSRASRL
jgi:hypothetical protein